MKSLVKFNDHSYSRNDVVEFYMTTKDAIESYYDLARNKCYKSAFRYKSCSDVKQEKEQCLEELSIEAGFALLAYLESVFRKDFVIRIERRKRKDELSRYFLDGYNPAKQLYQYPLEDIFRAWHDKGCGLSNKIRQTFSSLRQYYDYRNWIAHGRYWKFKEVNYLRKYCYESILLMVDTVLKELNGKLLT